MLREIKIYTEIVRSVYYYIKKHDYVLNKEFNCLLSAHIIQVTPLHFFTECVTDESWYVNVSLIWESCMMALQIGRSITWLRNIRDYYIPNKKLQSSFSWLLFCCCKSNTIVILNISGIVNGWMFGLYQEMHPIWN